MSDAAGRLHAHIVAEVVRALQGAEFEQLRDIIVVQLLVDSDDVDRRHEAVTIAWNTGRHLSEMRSRVRPIERPGLEWNVYGYAQPDAGRIADAERDPLGAKLRESWLRAVGMWYEDDEDDDVTEGIDLSIAFNEALVAAAQPLHADGTLERLVGRDVPVFILDDLGDPEALRKVNRRANPPQFHERLDRWSATWRE